MWFPTFLLMQFLSKEHRDCLNGINSGRLNTRDSYNKKNVILGIFAKNPVLKLLLSKCSMPFNRI